MDRIEEFVDERQQAWCIHCSRWLAGLETNEDHVPTKSFLSKPRPHNLPSVTICRECNNGFSRDEQYAVTFLSCVLSGTTEPDRQQNASAARALAKSARFRAMIDRAKTEYQTLGGETRVVWQPDVERINRVIIKNARGHAYFEYGEPLMETPSHVWAAPLGTMSASDHADFESVNNCQELAALPEVGSRMMTRVFTGQDLDDGWVVVQDGAYRYAVHQTGVLRVRSVWWEYLATEVKW
ncbi:hypothetical protein SAMN05444149_107143 [Pseudosulfitobacter pseudonitzschiae]|uniref:hypothetical protein n=1 Tax=Pseudosulfitobacter pseudonitzschiae TaxID=1402135 RepID=UPI000560702D|nr:hypothetical protein [Pseudosulfitobacter pseudonitzschiae]QKS07436.1 hypothetical protein HT745_02550 [Pseudosulfitobacter pseudonitzschiae]SHF98047.1 hypothetical protein SAMN05444149_107143 [Pseudosulfitobacter pseudonitzschiae]